MYDACLFYSTVMGYDQEHQLYKIYPKGSGASKSGALAYLLSNIPVDQAGGGFVTVPKYPEGTPVLAAAIGSTYYILGFIPQKGITLRNSAVETQPVTVGETRISNPYGSFLALMQYGITVLFTNPWAWLSLNPISQTVAGWFRNAEFNFMGGFFKWNYKIVAKTSRIVGEIWKSERNLRDTQSTPPEYLRYQFGALEDDKHIVEIATHQENISKDIWKVNTLLKYGLQRDRKILDLTLEDTDKKVRYTITIDLNGVLEYTSKKDSKDINMKLDVSSGDMVHVGVNKNKAELKIDEQGNIKIVANPTDAKIYVGGTGREQRLVTKGFVDMIYKTHIHPNGNQGSPTGPPMTPPITDPGVDTPTGPFTNTLKGE